MAENDLINRRIKQMENENRELKDRFQRGKSDIDKYKNENQSMMKKHREFEDLMNEMGRKSNLNER